MSDPIGYDGSVIRDFERRLPPEPRKPAAKPIKATYTLEREQLGEILREWAQKRGLVLERFSIEVQTGDPGDPREAGYRREFVRLDVEVKPCG